MPNLALKLVLFGQSPTMFTFFWNTFPVFKNWEISHKFLLQILFRPPIKSQESLKIYEKKKKLSLTLSPRITNQIYTELLFAIRLTNKDKKF